MPRLLFLGALLLACAACACAAHPLIRLNGVHGALNQRLTREQLALDALPAIEPQWFAQTLDHSDLASSDTFQQRYYVNASFVRAGSPVFLVIGGEGPVSPVYVTDHFITGALAAEHQALLVTLEHRFYGQSVPGNDSSSKNLRLLSSDQALEDLVTFRAFIRQQFPDTSDKWVVFGGSYSGALAAFARSKYPQLFTGAFATSAPVQAQLDFQQYFEVVARSLGESCSAIVASSTAALTQLLASNRTQLQQAFNLCSPIVSNDDAMNFVSTLSGPIADIVQYDNDNRAGQMYNSDVLCQKLEAADTPLDGLIQVWNDYNAFNNNTACTDVTYDALIASMQPTSDARSWTYQTCIEFGFFQTAEASDQPFSPLISLESFLKQCTDIFQIEGLTPNVQFINDYYGGNRIESTNTVFANGDVDPWHILGNYQKYPPSAQSDAFLIKGTAHCADLYPARDTDLPELTAARKRQAELLAAWLGDSEAPAAAAETAAAEAAPIAAPAAAVPVRVRSRKRIVLTEL